MWVSAASHVRNKKKVSQILSPNLVDIRSAGFQILEDI